tara:strand:+ start:319 stop:525 length:207 start_codon:yes stop_codon:yes gene_type:complete
MAEVSTCKRMGTGTDIVPFTEDVSEEHRVTIRKRRAYGKYAISVGARIFLTILSDMGKPNRLLIRGTK